MCELNAVLLQPLLDRGCDEPLVDSDLACVALNPHFDAVSIGGVLLSKVLCIAEPTASVLRDHGFVLEPKILQPR